MLTLLWRACVFEYTELLADCEYMKWISWMTGITLHVHLLVDFFEIATFPTVPCTLWVSWAWMMGFTRELFDVIFVVSRTTRCWFVSFALQVVTSKLHHTKPGLVFLICLADIVVSGSSPVCKCLQYDLITWVSLRCVLLFLLLPLLLCCCYCCRSWGRGLWCWWWRCYSVLYRLWLSHLFVASAFGSCVGSVVLRFVISMLSYFVCFCGWLVGWFCICNRNELLS